MDKKALKVLKELEKTKQEFWNISKETGVFLNTLIRISNIKKILEIGTSNGVSAIYMAEALKSKGSAPTHQIYTIESNYKLRFPLAKANFAKTNLTPYVTQILGHAPEVIPKTPKFFDLFFLDATKYEHADYLKAIIPKMKKGSIIIADNAISHKEALKPYVRELKKYKSLKTQLIQLGSGLLITVKDPIA